MFKWVSLIKISGKASDKMEGFNSATLPMKMDNVQNSFGSNTFGNLYDTKSTLDGRSTSQDTSSFRGYFTRQDIDKCFEEEECLWCSNPGMKCLQLRRKIYREERLRDGADKLLGIITDVKVRIKILSELNSINTKLQTLRLQHSQLQDTVMDNTNISPKKCYRLPMLSPELKELKMTDCFEPLKNHLRAHYYEDPNNFRTEFSELYNLRKKCSNPRIDEEGLEIIHQYFNQLLFIERRFLSEQSINSTNNNDDDDDDDDDDGDDNDYYHSNYHHENIIFEWYDTFTGMKSCQSSISFERGCLLFNIGVVYSKMAIIKRKLNHSDNSYFQRASGIFRHLRENFSNAPSCDIQWNCSEMLMELMLLQQHEVLVEEELTTILHFEFDFKAIVRTIKCISHIAKGYSSIGLKLSGLTSIPRSWCDLVDCKHDFYESFCHYLLFLLCQGILNFMEEGMVGIVPDHLDLFGIVHGSYEDVSEENMVMKGVTHLQSSIHSIEEALKKSKNQIKLQFAVHHTFRQLLQKATDKLFELQKKYNLIGKPPTHIQSLGVLSLYAHGDDLKPIPPDFSRYHVEDLFHRLGCLSIFSSHRKWTHPRVITLDRKGGEELGFSVSGDCPAIIASVQASSLASNTSMKLGDFIISINDIDVKWVSHSDVIQMIKSSKDTLSVTLVTPKGRNHSLSSKAFTGTESLASSTTLNADDFSSKNFSTNQVDAETVSSSTSTSKKSLVASLLFDHNSKHSKILSVLKSGSLSRTYQIASKKFSKRKEIINTDNVVIVERN